MCLFALESQGRWISCAVLCDKLCLDTCVSLLWNLKEDGVAVLSFFDKLCTFVILSKKHCWADNLDSFDDLDKVWNFRKSWKTENPTKLKSVSLFAK